MNVDIPRTMRAWLREQAIANNRTAGEQIVALLEQTMRDSGATIPTLPGTTVDCQGCGQPFMRRRGSQLYCSRRCKDKHTVYAKVERTCETCGTVFSMRAKDLKPGRGRFCSQACFFKSAAFRLKEAAAGNDPAL